MPETITITDITTVLVPFPNIPQVKEVEPMAQRDEISVQGHTATKWQRQDLNQVLSKP